MNTYRTTEVATVIGIHPNTVRLKVIRALRCAKYSLEAILRMLRQLSKNPDLDIKAALNTPLQSEDIISVCDRLIISLTTAEYNAKKIMEMLQEMKENY